MARCGVRAALEKETMPARLSRLIVALAAFALGGICFAGGLIGDDSKIEDPKLRAKIARATESLRESGSGLAALEVLVGFFGEAVVDTVCSNVSYSFSDPTKKEAYIAILDWYSLEFLDKTLRQGSDLARYWALRKLWHQQMNSRPEPDDNYKRLAARGGIVNDAAKTKIRETVLKVAKEATPRTRGFAIFVVARVRLVENLRAFLEDNLNDENAAVVAAAISGLADIRGGDLELDDTVWARLENAKDEELVVACLDYLWLDDRTSLDERKQRILEGLLDNPRVGKYGLRSLRWGFVSPRSRVLQALARALSERATPENPRMIALLLRLAQEKDKRVRRGAIRSLRNASAPFHNFL